MKKNNLILNSFALTLMISSVVLAPMVMAAENGIDDQSASSTSDSTSTGFARGRHQGQDQNKGESNGGNALGKATAGIGNKNFCTRFTASSAKYGSSVSDQTTKLQSRIDAESQKILANRQSSDAALKQNREKAAQNRQAIYAKLNSKATTDAQKQAVATFQSTIEAAVTAREAAVDAARTAYRKGVDDVLSQHQAAMKDYLATFKSSIQVAIDQASGQCKAGADSATVKETFQNAMQAAKAAHKSEIQQKVEVGPQLEQLAKTRNAAIQSAMQTYQTSMKEAVNALKTAFGETASVGSVSE